MKKSLESVLFALLACVAFMVTLVAANAPAQASGTVCYDDFDCPSGYSCEYGACELVSFCGSQSHVDYGPVTAVFEVWPGRTIVVTGGGNTYDPVECSTNPGCGLTYSSSAFIDQARCDAGSCENASKCRPGQVCTTGGSFDPTYTFYHSHLVSAGKYKVTDTKRMCHASGGYVVELTPCNC